MSQAIIFCKSITSFAQEDAPEGAGQALGLGNKLNDKVGVVDNKKNLTALRQAPNSSMYTTRKLNHTTRVESFGTVFKGLKSADDGSLFGAGWLREAAVIALVDNMACVLLGKNIELGVFIGIILRLDSPLQSICCVSGTKRALVLSFLGLGKSGFKAEEKISEVHLNLSRAIIEERIFLSGYCTIVERQERKSRRPFQIRGGLSKLPRQLLLNFYSVINRDPRKGLRLKFCRCVNQYKRYPPA